MSLHEKAEMREAQEIRSRKAGRGPLEIVRRNIHIVITENSSETSADVLISYHKVLVPKNVSFYGAFLYQTTQKQNNKN